MSRSRRTPTSPRGKWTGLVWICASSVGAIPFVASAGCGERSSCAALCSEEMSLAGAFEPPNQSETLVLHICVGEACERGSIEPDRRDPEARDDGDEDESEPRPSHECRDGSFRCTVDDGYLSVSSSSVTVGSHPIAVDDVVRVRVTRFGSKESLLDVSIPVREVGANGKCGSTCGTVELYWE